MKKVLALVMCIAMIASFAVTASAADYEVTFTVSNHENAKVGDVLDVTVSISEGSDLGALEFFVIGDTQYLKPVSKPDKRGNAQWMVEGDAAGGSIVCSDDKYIEEGRLEFACANDKGYWDPGVFVTVYFEVIAELPEEGAAIDIQVNATTHFEVNTKTYEVKENDGLVKGVKADDTQGGGTQGGGTQGGGTQGGGTQGGGTVTPPVEESTTDIPETGDATGIAVAAGLCAVMAAAFVITKKVND